MRDKNSNAEMAAANGRATKWRFQLNLASLVIVTLASAIFPEIPANAQPQTQAGTKTGAVTGRPLPRFASLKASRINLRKGPGTNYPIAWVFSQIGLPVEIINEFEAWRQIRDAEGTEGWVLRTLLSGRRTAQIMPWQMKSEGARQQTPITSRATKGSRTVALVEAGVVADLFSCDGAWCNVAVGQYNGFVPQNTLWGVYKDERVR